MDILDLLLKNVVDQIKEAGGDPAEIPVSREALEGQINELETLEIQILNDKKRLVEERNTQAAAIWSDRVFKRE